MPNVVTEALIESYALMFLVMSAFFVYFCGMVWAFCNPKLSGIADGTECDRFSQVPLQEIFADPEDMNTTNVIYAPHVSSSEYPDRQTERCYIASSYIVDWFVLFEHILCNNTKKVRIPKEQGRGKFVLLLSVLPKCHLVNITPFCL